jgi:hypothetical protein
MDVRRWPAYGTFETNGLAQFESAIGRETGRRPAGRRGPSLTQTRLATPSTSRPGASFMQREGSTYSSFGGVLELKMSR